jgi:hypothetical protein
MLGFNDDPIWFEPEDNEDCYPSEEPVYYQDKYLYDYQWYHESFPVEWAVYHEDETGPGQCSNCAKFGSVNGIFIGYCANCAIYIYEGKRGRGFIDSGLECADEDCLDFPSAYDTYLKDVDILAIEGVDESDDEEDAQVIEEDDSDDDEEVEEDEDEYENTLDDDTDTSILNCHYEGGYNDF